MRRVIDSHLIRIIKQMIPEKASGMTLGTTHLALVRKSVIPR